MKRLAAGLLLVMACDKGATAPDGEAAPKAKDEPAVEVSETMVDQAALAALCIRATLSVELNGETSVGVLTDKKDGTKRFGWVAGTLAPSPFGKLTAEQAGRELEQELKVADTMQQRFAATCTEALKDANPVVLTFTIEQKPSAAAPTPGYWVVAGTTRSRTIEFVAAAPLADAQKKALALALETTKATGFNAGKTVDRGNGQTVLCPGDWCESLE